MGKNKSLSCRNCPDYDNGRGTKACLICPDITDLTPVRSLREKLGQRYIDIATVDYKAVLIELSAIRQRQLIDKSMTDTHRAILTLHLAQFSPTQIAILLKTSRKTVYRIIRIFK